LEPSESVLEVSFQSELLGVLQLLHFCYLFFGFCIGELLIDFYELLQLFVVEPNLEQSETGRKEIIECFLTSLHEYLPIDGKKPVILPTDDTPQKL